MKKRILAAFLLAALCLSVAACSPAEDTYKVTLCANNGSADEVLQVEKGGVLAELPTPEKRACTFTGWYLDGKLWEATAPVNSDLTLTAGWTLAENAFAAPANADHRPEGTAVRVGSFNVLLTKLYPMLDRGEKLAETIRRYLPDVFGMQEFNSGWYAEFEDFLPEYALVNADDHNILGKNNDTTIAYREAALTLVEFGQQPYSESDSISARTITWALFETKDGSATRFIVTTTHWGLTEEHRLIHAQDLAKRINKLREKYKVPVIATGDFNTREGTQPYLDLAGTAGLASAKLTAGKRGLACETSHKLISDETEMHILGPASFTDTHVGPATSIDHIFSTDGAKALYYDTAIDEAALFVSDHCLIYADYMFP